MIQKPYNDLTSSSELLKLIPPSIFAKCSSDTSDSTSIIHQCIFLMPSYPKQDELSDFFREVGINKEIWCSLPSKQEKIDYTFKALQRNIEQKIEKVKHQLTSYVSTNKNLKPTSKPQKKPSDFDWLNLQTNNEMLKPKLKTKLVQAINQYKNQAKLRLVHGKVLDESEKVALEDDSFELKPEDSISMKYDWTTEDQEIFHMNLKSLKDKFNNTEFLKNCHRYKFITEHELCTLASEEVSRKLDKSTKAFLSREFLLDKYFSTKQNLTEKQMKFILKTSPFLSKCVDKSFVKAAIRNIRYEDINKMELQIAENIIKKFQSIRSLVKQSRKQFKQKKNQKVKANIKKFQQKTKHEAEREVAIDDLQKHTTKLMRKMNYKSAGVLKNQNNFSQSKKIYWPVPLNNMHPSTGLFIKDSPNEQINSDLNPYEKKYLQSIKNPCPVTTSKAEMIRFYSGGPLENMHHSSPQIDGSTVKLICDIFKTSFYHKQICLKLDNISVEEIQNGMKKSLALRTAKSLAMECLGDGTKRTKKSANSDTGQNENLIKQKILEGRQKTKNAVFTKKLLFLAAENSFATLKGLNPKLSPSQINAVDQKGNSALFYAIKHRNIDFIDYLLSKKADPNIRCSRGFTPLHMAFKTNQYSLICKCLTGTIAPNLNSLDDQNKTPLYYCSRRILEMLSLEDGVVMVDNKNCKFDNNELLHNFRPHNYMNQELEHGFDIKKGSYRENPTVQPY